MKILANGCSFSEGYNLDSKDLAWPSVVADNTNAELANFALGGSSNHRIFRSTIEYLNEVDPDLVIIGWTMFDRGELTHESGMYLRLTSDSCLPDTIELGKDLSHVHKFWTNELYNSYLNYRSWIQNIIHLQNHFLAKRIKFLFFSAFGDNYIHEYLNDTDRSLLLSDNCWHWRDRTRYTALRDLHDEHRDLVRQVNKIELTHWIGNSRYTMQDYLAKKDFKVDSTGHFFADGHRAWGNHIIECLDQC